MTSCGSANLLIRADGSDEIGMGHVMRCLSLGIAWRKASGHVTLATVQPSQALERIAKEADLRLVPLSLAPGSQVDQRATRDAARRAGAIWVVLDGYGFGVSFQDTLRQSNFKVLVIDDIADASTYHADVLLNGNVHASALHYQNRTLPNTKLLLGPGFALLRPGFVGLASEAHSSPEKAHRLLVSLGGGSNDAILAKISEALQMITSLRLEVTILPGASDSRRIAEEIEGSRHGVNIVESEVADMAGHLAGADMALLGGGVTFLEAACLGVPAIVIVIADNQEPTCKLLQSRGIALVIGRGSTIVPSKLAAAIEALSGDLDARRRLSTRARNVVDGRGAQRVVAEMLALAA